MSVYEWRSAPRADFAVLGDPIAHSLSPKMHQAAYKALGIAKTYLAIRVPQSELSEALEHLSFLGYRGVNLTVPLKGAGAAWAVTPDEFVRRCGSANTLSLDTGNAINTDALGFLDTLRPLGVKPPSTVLLLGAGGSARALALALDDVGYRVRVFNRTRERAEALVSSLGIEAEIASEPDPTGAALIVNATSASLHGEAPAVIWQRAEKRALAYDLAYGPELSPFLLQAALAGMKVVNGLELLVMQGARSISWWLDCQAPIEAMREAVR